MAAEGTAVNTVPVGSGIPPPPQMMPNPLLHVREDSGGGAKHSANYTPPPATNLLVIKVGTTSLLCDETTSPGFSLSNVGRLVDSVVHIHSLGYQVVLVTSGAVGAGCLHLKLERPSKAIAKQAVSAVGQCRLMRLYEDLFAIREKKVAQLLITRTDFCDKIKFLNFKNTLLELLSMGVIPIINENDSVASSQLKFGDNDTLAAYCAISLSANWLILLSDVDCLYTANPRTHLEAEKILYVGRLDDVYNLVSDGDTKGSSWGSGGMRTKIIAAKLTSATGIKTALCHGKFPERVIPILQFYEALDAQGEENNGTETEAMGKTSTTDTTGGTVTQKLLRSCAGRGKDGGLVTVGPEETTTLPYIGTVFSAHEVSQHIADQKRWILSLPVRGTLHVDPGAAHAVVGQSSSLLAPGIVCVEGEFYEGEAVSIYPATAKMLLTRNEKKCETTTIDAAAQLEGKLYTTVSVEKSSPNSVNNKKELDSLIKMEKIKTRERSHPELAGKMSFDGISQAEADLPELARCLTNYSSQEIGLIKGVRSEKFSEILGFAGPPEIAHRANIIHVHQISTETNSSEHNKRN